MVNTNIHLFLIPMPFCTFVLFWTLSFAYESSCIPLFLNFHPGSSIHSVLLCEISIQSFSSRTERNFWQFSTYDSAFSLMYDAFIGVFDSYLPFDILFLAWDHLYLIYCLPCFFPWALCCHSL